MNVLIRADASRDIGFGHVMRCMALADALRDGGARVRFLCRALPGDARETIRAAGYEAIAIGADSPLDDAVACHAVLDGEAPVDWLVVDHYRLDARWGRAMRSRCHQILAIDDLADRDLECDLLLDQNWHDAPDSRYLGHIPSYATTLFGPHWALLRGEFAQTRDGVRVRDGSVRRILVCFGGADAPNATGASLRALGALRGITLDVVVGAGNPHVSELRELCAGIAGATLAVGATDMAERMAAADLFIGAGGSMTWERACLGLPGITLAIADNQLALGARIAAAGEGVDLGMATAQAFADLPAVLGRLIAGPDTVRAMGCALMARCDGHGAARVARLLADDCELLTQG
jgi:UDP-2,4-diacetamido-2,4,6-trideoxy-beta-L-altropyranose hydrolase